MPSVLGEAEVTVLKILISTRNRVINIAIRPGTTSGGTKKLTQDTTTNRPVMELFHYLPNYPARLHDFFTTEGDN